ncbi:protein Aster-B isoform X1 [Microcebus murinus]|uniref:protein Aster-B isoform X1 n=1 Tax=Microcebus murinus TaxID=30608 RepID=UPI000643E63B|nr:GRAM domain-containing protein 1B isoform X1 [Microcebus murinus]XP_012645310.1 GRAM domain-containing protein 1B isoform X1 [Microcebus murinus]XP_012645311.1 GRAM domain-containing protein 1B isoform X1 [Microcebus murinus]XP_012645312.1 GRAM domain-containing protein 1B isoform X1 [Microcebus murinus]XP_012645313.1 GRAM domain-containing protein 1B isoform X1 [Microcebus murinus]
MPAANMMENLQLPALQVPEPQGAPEGSPVWSSSSTPTLRRRRFKMRRMKNVQEQSLEAGLAPGKEFLQLPSIEITPSSDEDTPWSNCSTPSASPRRKRFLLRKWLRVRERKECSESSSQQSSQQSSHDDDSSRFLSPRAREEGTASNSNRSTPACSPILRKRPRSPTPQNQDGDAMVEKGSDHSSDKSPSTPEQGVQRSCSSQSGRSGGKNSKKSQSWYNVLSPTYKQRNEDFRKLFKQLPDTERLIVDYSCALQRDILLQGRLYLSENWICFYSNIFRWETLLTVRLKDICSMTKEKTARLIPNAIQVCTDSEKHFFTSFGARDRTYMMMFRLWQNALLEKPLCPKELWHFVHQCYGNELGLTSDDEDYVPPDDDFNTMGYCEEIPVEENEVNDSSSKSSIETKPDASPQLPKKSITNSTLTSTGSSEAPVSFDGLPLEEEVLEGDGSLEKELAIDNIIGEKIEIIAPVNSPSLDFNDNEDIPTELSDSSDTHDEGEVQAFYEDLSGRQYVNEVFNFSVDKLYDLLFTNSPFQRDFMEQRRFSDIIFHPWKKEENGNQSRVILYTVTLTNPLAPKTATVRETQTMYKASQESECYVIDAEVLTHDVPYHDYFYTINRYTLTRVARNKSRLRVSTELRYRKQPWGLVKTFIEKNFWSGLEDYFRHLESELAKTESTYLAEMHRQSPKEKASKPPTVRRRKRPHAHLRVPHLEEVMSPVTTPTDEDVGHRIKHVAGSTQTRHIPEDTPNGFHLQSVSKLLLVISCVICFSLVLLVILNMMLFYKLWMLEYTTQTLTAWQGLRLQERLPQSQTEWAQLLESQQKYHDTELQKWREIIKSSVMLLDQMKDSLINLQNGIRSRDYTSESEEKRNRYH